MSNAHKYRPEVQARKIADLSNPEVQRRKKMYREARGYLRERITEWNHQWNREGRPRQFPDFPEWDAVNKPLMDAKRAEARTFQRRINRWHAAWVAAGMPTGFPNMQEWEASQAHGEAA